MNCKQGDLAIIVKSTAGNEGKIVRCLKFVPAQKFYTPDKKIVQWDAWEVDSAFISWNGTKTSIAPDRMLKPIRDNDGEDEMLRIAGKPKQLEGSFN
jgi:hypothetical protein